LISRGEPWPLGVKLAHWGEDPLFPFRSSKEKSEFIPGGENMVNVVCLCPMYIKPLLQKQFRNNLCRKKSQYLVQLNLSVGVLP
jgi:hypothetical protein